MTYLDPPAGNHFKKIERHFPVRLKHQARPILGLLANLGTGGSHDHRAPLGQMLFLDPRKPSYGVANLAIVHRLSDLRSQTDDGTAAAKVSMGLLADTQTRAILADRSQLIAANLIHDHEV